MMVRASLSQAAYGGSPAWSPAQPAYRVSRARSLVRCPQLLSKGTRAKLLLTPAQLYLGAGVFICRWTYKETRRRLAGGEVQAVFLLGRASSLAWSLAQCRVLPA